MLNKEQLPLEDRAATDPVTVSKDKRKKLPAMGIVGIVLGALALCFVALCTVAALRQTVLPNTSLLGMELGGLSKNEVAVKWLKGGHALCESQGIALMDEDGRELTSVSYSDMSAFMTPRDVARYAYAAGRGQDFFSNGWRFLRSWFVPTVVQPHFRINQETLTAKVEELAATVENGVVEGGFALINDGEKEPGLYLTKPKAGQRIMGDKLLSSLNSALNSGQDTVKCQFESVTPEALDVDAIHTQLQGEKIEARYIKGSGEILPSHVGVAFDIDAVKKQLAETKDGETILAQAQVDFPHMTTEMLEAGLFRDVLGTYTTVVSGTAARIRNVYLAAQKINGRIYNPGETFWYNATVGERTEAGGFGPAPAYVGGKTVDSVGGGICQVSSTLYYATLLANLQIVTRYCHQFAPGYITWGCDATVSWGFPDFAFRNNTEYPIQIVTDWIDNKLTVTILGTKTDDTYVEMSNAVLSSTPWETRYEINEEMAPGSAPVEVQTPYTGYLVKTYRNIYAGDGTLISSTFEASSDYEKRDRIYQVDRETYYQMFGTYDGPVADLSE